MAYCENQVEVYYCLGYSVNARLKKAVATPLWKLQQEVTDDQGEVETAARRFTELRYRTKDSWSRERRVIAKLELLPGKTNLRFIVTNLPGEGFDEQRDQKRFQSQDLYEDFYCARGDMEPSGARETACKAARRGEAGASIKIELKSKKWTSSRIAPAHIG